MVKLDERLSDALILVQFGRLLPNHNLEIEEKSKRARLMLLMLGKAEG